MTFQEYKSAYWSMPASYREHGDMPTTIEMYDDVNGFISDVAFNLVKEMDICSSSLDSNGLPMDYSDTAHKWNEDEGVCDECGASKDNEPCDCPNCNTSVRENDIDYLGDGKYQCPNCKELEMCEEDNKPHFWESHDNGEHKQCRKCLKTSRTEI